MPPPTDQNQKDAIRFFLAAVPVILLQSLSLQLGSAVAKFNFNQISPVLVAGMRLCFAALIMLVVVRPCFRGFTGREWIFIAAFGVVIAAMNITYFTAIQYLPLSIATTFELLGPLGIAVVLARRLLHWLAAGLALVGVCLLAIPVDQMGLAGVTLGLAAGVLRGGYILLSKYVGASTEGLSGLVAALSVGGVLVLPIVAWQDASILITQPRFLLVGLAVAVLSSVIPYCLDFLVLRRLKVETFGVLMALSPAVAAGVGLAAFGEVLSPQAISGILLIVAASMMAVPLEPRRHESLEVERQS